MEVTAVLSERPDQQTLNEIHTPEQSNEMIPRIIVPGDEDEDVTDERNLGLTLESYSNPRERIWGLKVTNVTSGSAAARAGVRQGDVVTILNGRAVRTMGDFNVALANPIRGSHILRFNRDGETNMVTIETGASAREMLQQLEDLLR
ncbi:MAG: PDZ domain-containing protein [Candidatus Sumerlaeia bacterium]|nr:PDZ domain-containing protein [Candidatus Sumerlaeia bacterium]